MGLESQGDLQLTEWDIRSLKGRVFMRQSAAEALRALADWFEPLEKENALLAITVEYDEQVTLTVVWEEKP